MWHAPILIARFAVDFDIICNLLTSRAPNELFGGGIDHGYAVVGRNGGCFIVGRIEVCNCGCIRFGLVGNVECIFLDEFVTTAIGFEFEDLEAVVFALIGKTILRKLAFAAPGGAVTIGTGDEFWAIGFIEDGIIDVGNGEIVRIRRIDGFGGGDFGALADFIIEADQAKNAAGLGIGAMAVIAVVRNESQDGLIFFVNDAILVGIDERSHERGHNDIG